MNSVAWQPYSGTLGTASADKTVCLWDARSGLPTLKLYGHAASCNCLAFSPEVRRTPHGGNAWCCPPSSGDVGGRWLER